jgi:hypothetical protein
MNTNDRNIVPSSKVELCILMIDVCAGRDIDTMKHLKYT